MQASGGTEQTFNAIAGALWNDPGDTLELADKIRLRPQSEKHELSRLFEARLKTIAAGNGGHGYTPRPLIRAILAVIQPRIGERIYDPAAGSAGFLCEAYDYLVPMARTAGQRDTLQNRTFYANEKNRRTHAVATANMILHGIDAPKIARADTLAESLAGLRHRDRFHVALANPPAAGNARPELQRNVPIQTAEPAFLFLQHVIKRLKPGGRAAVVIKRAFLSNPGAAAVALRRALLTTCDLHTVLVLPQGAVHGPAANAVVLFFQKSRPTRTTWFYGLDPGRTLGNTSPLGDPAMAEFVRLQAGFVDGPRSWSVDSTSLDHQTWDLSPNNPNAPDAGGLRSPAAILADLATLAAESARILERAAALLDALEPQAEALADVYAATLAALADLTQSLHANQLVHRSATALGKSSVSL